MAYTERTGVKGLGEGQTQSKCSANVSLAVVKAQVYLLRKPSISPSWGWPHPAQESHTDRHCPSAWSLTSTEVLKDEAPCPWVPVTEKVFMWKA